MTIRLTEAEVEEQFQEADEEELQFDPADERDITLKYDTRFAQGWRREIDLREDGIRLEIDQSQSKEHVIVDDSDRECHYVNCCFLLLGNAQDRLSSTSGEILLQRTAGQYHLSGTGPHGHWIYDYDTEPWSSITFSINKKTVFAFATSLEGELPKNRQHLIKPFTQMAYYRYADIQPTMIVVLQQILKCPYQGMVKRAYLESKVIELMALVLDHEGAIQQGEVKQVSLKPEQIERIHYAKEILVKDLNNPPSLAELARQVGLNDYLLKQGFRQVFGTTVFGELQAYRLDFAKQLLAEKSISMTEISRLVGYANRNAFSRAFKRKFGFSPIDYRKSCR
ncbi:MAG: AraC family transcriptional regulator [Cyanobacteria bacterium P01_F01_bin.150]